jgi:hypothetical protein
MMSSAFTIFLSPREKKIEAFLSASRVEAEEGGQKGLVEIIESGEILSYT